MWFHDLIIYITFTDDEIKYSKSHEWACLSGTTAKVGISDYAQDKLGEVVYVDLPDIGLEVEAGGEYIIIKQGLVHIH